MYLYRLLQLHLERLYYPWLLPIGFTAPLHIDRGAGTHLDGTRERGSSTRPGCFQSRPCL
jgi:hypothetical protein